jgi:hypothetical protein
MDHLKVRAWDKEKQCMVYGVENAYDSCGFTDEEGNSVDYHIQFFGEVLESKYSVMLSTCQKDVLGNLVWEGDFIEFDDAIKGSLKKDVLFYKGCFGVFRDSEHNDFLPLCSITKLKVVSNIWNFQLPKRHSNGFPTVIFLSN